MTDQKSRRGKKKRFIAIALLAALVFALGAAAFALRSYSRERRFDDVPAGSAQTEEKQARTVSSGKCGENLNWVLSEDGTLTISGTGAMDRSVWEKTPWEAYNVRSVVINEGVTYIESFVFYGCSEMTSITIPESVTGIGDNAFDFCSSLTSIEIPKGVTSIGSYAFDFCGSLTSIEIPEGVTSIGNNTFYGCGSLTNVTIPESVTSIGDAAFAGCSSLTNIEIPEGVTSIGYGAFLDCGRLESIALPESLTYIDEYAFASCSSMQTVYCPGAEAQRDQIEIGMGNEALSSAVWEEREASPEQHVSPSPYLLWSLLSCAGLGFAAICALALFSGRKKSSAKSAEAQAGQSAGPQAEAVDSLSGSELDLIVEEGSKALAEMRRIAMSIQDDEVRGKINELIRITDQIVQDAIQDPSDVPKIKKFMNYYLPTTIKLLNAYARMSSAGVKGTNLDKSMKGIREMLDDVVTAYEKWFDSLFAEQTLDIETDIDVMYKMLAREGLLGDKDFQVRQAGDN